MRRPISALVRTAAIGRAAAGQRGAEGAVGELAYGPSPYARPPRSPPRFFRHVSTASMRRRHPAAARLQSAALLLEHCCNSRFYCAAFSSCASRSASAIHLHDLPHRHVRRHRRPRGALIKIILRTRQGHQREGVSGGGGQRRRTARTQSSQTGSAGSAKRARHAMRRRRSLRAKRDGSWRQQAGRARVRRAAHRESQPPRSDRWAGRCQGAELRELPFAV